MNDMQSILSYLKCLDEIKMDFILVSLSVQIDWCKACYNALSEETFSALLRVKTCIS